MAAKQETEERGMIPVPGCVDKLAAAIYHRHLSLSAGGAINVMKKCAAYYRHTSPWGPAREYKADLDFVIGTAVHLATLEPDEFKARTVILPETFDNYRKSEAQQIRDEAAMVGKTPLLAKQVIQVAAIRESIMAHPWAKRHLPRTVPERSYFWKDADTGLQCKMRVDAMPADGSYMVDVKTTENATPRAVQRTAANNQWPMRAAWYIDGYEAFAGCPPDDYFFLAVETEAPFLVKVYTLSPRAIEWGRAMNRRAIEIVADALKSGHWPDYGEHPEEIDLPSWEEMHLEERREAGEFETRASVAERYDRDKVSPFM